MFYPAKCFCKLSTGWEHELLRPLWYPLRAFTVCWFTFCLQCCLWNQTPILTPAFHGLKATLGYWELPALHTLYDKWKAVYSTGWLENYLQWSTNLAWSLHVQRKKKSANQVSQWELQTHSELIIMTAAVIYDWMLQNKLNLQQDKTFWNDSPRSETWKCSNKRPQWDCSRETPQYEGMDLMLSLNYDCRPVSFTNIKHTVCLMWHHQHSHLGSISTELNDDQPLSPVSSQICRILL